MRSIIFISLSVFFCSMNLYAQDWESIVTATSSEISEGVSIKLHNNKQYFTGVFQNDLSIGFNTVSGDQFDDIFLGKADLNGYVEWIIDIRGSEIDRASHIELHLDQVLISGIFSDTLYVGTDTLYSLYQKSAFIAYYDTTGNYIKCFQPEAYNAEFTDFKFNSQGNLIICGEFFQYLNYGGFHMDVISGLNFFVMSYDPIQDSILWAQWGTGSSSLARSICIDNQDNVYVTGSYNEGTYFVDTLINSENGNHNLFVAKFNSYGNKQWVNTIEGTSEVHGYGVTCDDSSNVFVIGEFEGIINLPGNQHISEGMLDVIVLKLDSNGDYVWSQGFGGVDSDEGYDICMDSNMDPVLLVEAGVNLTYQSNLLTTSGWNEPLLLKIENETGNLVWYKRLESTVNNGIVNATSISIENDFIAITGINRTSIIMNNDEYVADNGKDFYTAILKDSLTYFLDVKTPVEHINVQAYPNPSVGLVNFKANEDIWKIDIVNMNGELVLRKECSSREEIMSLSELMPGLYTAQVFVNDLTCFIKLIILE